MRETGIIGKTGIGLGKMKKAAHVIFRGRVQGVFFRANTQKKAQNGGITGWVRNQNDGCVEAWFEGKEADVSRLTDDIGRGDGMGSARVDGIEVRWSEPKGYSDFDVIR